MLKADGPAVRILWSIDCSEACVTAAVRTGQTGRGTLLTWVLTNYLRHSGLDSKIPFSVPLTAIMSFRLLKETKHAGLRQQDT